MASADRPKFMAEIISTWSGVKFPCQIGAAEAFDARTPERLEEKIQQWIHDEIQRAYCPPKNPMHQWFEPRINRINIEIVRKWEEQKNG